MAITPLLQQNVDLLMSGPGGLGQNFQGFSSYQPGYITGTFRAPFTVQAPTVPLWYVAPISISNITVPTNPGRYIEVTFTTPEATPPFREGDTVIIDNVDPSFYNDTYSRSVVSCTTTGVILDWTEDLTWPAYISGGDISKDVSDKYNSTDCNARVTVTGPTEQVFISCQMQLDVSWTCSVESSFYVEVAIRRYRGFLDTAPGAVDYLFDADSTEDNPDAIVSRRQYFVTDVTESSFVDTGDNIFTTVLDSPGFGFYWYIADVKFVTTAGDAKPEILTVNLRSFTAQVIKQ